MTAISSRRAWLSLADVGRALRLPFAAVLRMVRRNELRAYFVAGAGPRGSWWVKASEVRRYVEQGSWRRAA